MMGCKVCNATLDESRHLCVETERGNRIVTVRCADEKACRFRAAARDARLASGLALRTNSEKRSLGKEVFELETVGDGTRARCLLCPWTYTITKRTELSLRAMSDQASAHLRDAHPDKRAELMSA